MLRECVEIFTEIYNEKGKRFITDSYELEPGDYFIVKSDGSYRHIKIERTKKTEENSNRRTIEDYEYLAERDYLSRLLEINKPIDEGKQIHSNNYLSFFVKNNVLNEKKKELEKSIEKYYEVLKNPFLKYDKGEKKKVYIQLEEKLGKPLEEKIQKNYEWIKENLYKIKEEIKDGKEYIKVFFDEDIEEYKKENERYIIPNIYNSVDYNVIIDNETYGLPNNNLNLNSKKPYLENKTRKKKYTVPYLLNEEEVFEQKKFFDYLYNMSNLGKRNIYISPDKKEIIPSGNRESLSDNFTGYYLRIKKGKKESEIERYEIISNYKAEFYSEIKILDCLRSGNKGELEYGSSISKISDLGAVLNDFLLDGKLYRIIFEKLKDLKISDEIMKNIANQHKETFFELLYKGEPQKFIDNYKEIFLELIKNSLRKKKYVTEAYDMFNLMTSIDDSIKKERGMTVNKHQEIKEKFRNIFETGVGEIENDEEYFFALGQLTKFLISRNKITSKNHDLGIRIIDSRDIEGIKMEIYKLLRRYAYDIGFYSTKFNTLYERVLGYEPESQKINMDRLLGGYLADSLIYEKSSKEENEVNNETKETNGEENE